MNLKWKTEKENEKYATIRDYARMCESFAFDCEKCPLGAYVENGHTCAGMVRCETGEANKIILDWCEAHPVRTRQAAFLERYPSPDMIDVTINICPNWIDNRLDYDCANTNCKECKSKYWLAEDAEK